MAKKSKVTLKNQNAFIKKLNNIMNNETKNINNRYLYQHTQKITNLAAKKMYSELSQWYNEYTPEVYIRSKDGSNLLSSITIVKYKTTKRYNYTFGLKLDYRQMNMKVLKNNPFNQHLSFSGEDFRLGLIDIITNTDYGHIPGILGYHHSQVDLFGSAEEFIKSEINIAEIKDISLKSYEADLSKKHGIKIKTKR